MVVHFIKKQFFLKIALTILFIFAIQFSFDILNPIFDQRNMISVYDYQHFRKSFLAIGSVSLGYEPIARKHSIFDTFLVPAHRNPEAKLRPIRHILVHSNSNNSPVWNVCWVDGSHRAARKVSREKSLFHHALPTRHQREARAKDRITFGEEKKGSGIKKDHRSTACLGTWWSRFYQPRVCDAATFFTNKWVTFFWPVQG